MDKIYQIYCAMTGMKYIGCTAGPLSKRYREHRCLLNAGKHKCSDFQKDWSLYGERWFWIRELPMFPEIEEMDSRQREIWWMKNFESRGELYNEHIISFEPPEGAQRKAAAARVANGYKPSPESNEKRRLAQLGVPKGNGAKISATKRAKQAMR